MSHSAGLRRRIYTLIKMGQNLFYSVRNTSRVGEHMEVVITSFTDKIFSPLGIFMVQQQRKFLCFLCIAVDAQLVLFNHEGLVQFLNWMFFFVVSKVNTNKYKRYDLWNISKLIKKRNSWFLYIYELRIMNSSFYRNVS